MNSFPLGIKQYEYTEGDAVFGPSTAASCVFRSMGVGIMSDIIIFGGDGYIGWPLALELASRHRDKDVIIADNYLTRRNAAKIGGAPFLPIASLADRVQAACEVLDLDNLKFQEIDASDPDAVTDF